MEELTQEQAIAFAENKMYDKMTSEQIVRFQLFQERLCMPFSTFHEAIEKVLGRPVFTHEFAYDGIKQEYLGTKPAPTLDEIINLMPEDKRILLNI